MQSQFFDPTQASNPDPPANPASTNPPAKRIFLYDGQIFEDPGPTYQIRDVLAALASTYPELENGTWHSRRLPDGSEEITFVKVTGEKGSEPDPSAAQSGFFETPPAAEPPLLPGPTASAPRRVFLYDGQIFEDPGPAYTTREVLTFLASTYPELENGTWHSRRLPDGTEEITFVKVTGEKGSQPPLARLGRDLSPRQLAACLIQLEPTDLQATGLVQRIIAAEKAGTLSAVTLMELGPEIEAALHQVEQIAHPSQRMLTRCLALKPVPQSTVPLGF